MSGFDDTPVNPGTGNIPGANPTDAGSATSNTREPYTSAYTAPGYGAPGFVPPPTPGPPNPGLATLLGFIPGVGAMYNGQFAKGIAHVAIFAILISLADHVDGIFGLLVAGWYFYMVFDSYQTARAHRDGLVPPDPFGLNNIGQRLGIGTGPNWSDFVAKPQAGTTPPPYTPPPPAGYGYAAGPQGTAYPDSAATYASGAGGTYDQQVPGGYTAPQSPYVAQPYVAQPYVAQAYPPPPAAPFGTYAAPYAPPPLPPLEGSNLPTGSIWLIGFGFLALLGTLSHRFYWSNRYLDGAIVGAIGLALLITRTMRARGVYPAGTAANTWYSLRSSRPGLILLAIGIALTFDHSGFLTWAYLWPYLLILVGVFLLMERAAHNRMLAADPIAADPSYTAPPASTTASFVPSVERDQEGR